MDCLNKLNSAMFNDSNTAKKIHCGRTKAEMLTANVLGPKTVRDILKDLSPTEGEHEPVYFSVATDASNKGNRKMLPVCLRYFNPTDGVQCKLLDFYENSDETANGIHRAIMDCLGKHQLNTECITSYAADNVNVTATFPYLLLGERNFVIFSPSWTLSGEKFYVTFALDGYHYIQLSIVFYKAGRRLHHTVRHSERPVLWC